MPELQWRLERPCVVLPTKELASLFREVGSKWRVEVYANAVTVPCLINENTDEQLEWCLVPSNGLKSVDRVLGWVASANEGGRLNGSRSIVLLREIHAAPWLKIWESEPPIRVNFDLESGSISEVLEALPEEAYTYYLVFEAVDRVAYLAGEVD